MSGDEKCLYLAPQHKVWTFLESAITSNVGTGGKPMQRVWLQLENTSEWRSVYPMAIIHASQLILVADTSNASSVMTYRFNQVWCGVW